MLDSLFFCFSNTLLLSISIFNQIFTYNVPECRDHVLGEREAEGREGRRARGNECYGANGPRPSREELEGHRPNITLHLPTDLLSSSHWWHLSES